MAGQLVVLVRASDDSRALPESLLELPGIDLQIRSILVGDAEASTPEAAVGDDVSKQLVKGNGLADTITVSVFRACQ
jgi:hypothetical protein